MISMLLFSLCAPRIPVDLIMSCCARFWLILTPTHLRLIPTFARLTPDKSQGVNLLYSAVSHTCRWWQHLRWYLERRRARVSPLEKKVAFAPFSQDATSCDCSASPSAKTSSCDSESSVMERRARCLWCCATDTSKLMFYCWCYVAETFSSSSFFFAAIKPHCGCARNNLSWHQAVDIWEFIHGNKNQASPDNKESWEMWGVLPEAVLNVFLIFFLSDSACIFILAEDFTEKREERRCCFQIGILIYQKSAALNLLHVKASVNSIWDTQHVSKIYHHIIPLT